MNPYEHIVNPFSRQGDPKVNNVQATVKTIGQQFKHTLHLPDANANHIILLLIIPSVSNTILAYRRNSTGEWGACLGYGNTGMKFEPTNVITGSTTLVNGVAPPADWEMYRVVSQGIKLDYTTSDSGTSGYIIARPQTKPGDYYIYQCC